MKKHRGRALAALVLLGPGSALAIAREDPAVPPGQVEWIASYPEALALAKAEGKPVVVCFNADSVDGSSQPEPANLHAATEIYRNADFVALSRSFVCVIASVFSHDAVEAERDGQPRSECSRFGWITCAEHRQCEVKARTALVGKSENIAPQHVILSPDGKVLERRAYHTPLADLMAMMERALGLGPGSREPADPKAQAAEIAGLFQQAERASWVFEKTQFVEQIRQLGTRVSRSALLDYLQSGKDDDTRAAVAITLAQSGDFLLLEPLLRATKDSNAVVSLAAVDALGKLALPSAAKDLARLLGKYPQGHDHGRVLRAYAACSPDDATALKRVLKEANSGDPVSRAHAVVALQYFDPSEDVNAAVRRALQDDSTTLQAAAAYCIAVSHNEELQPELEEVARKATNQQLAELCRAAAAETCKEGIEGFGTATLLEWQLHPFLPLGDHRRF